MRYINPDDVEQVLPVGWLARAKKAREEVRALPEGERAKAISDKSDVWSALKPALATLSNGKCWYCESSVNRTSMDVDHFRPKNRVLEHPLKEGYWWLAFDWRNYRLSCEFCNRRRKVAEEWGGQVVETSGGKHDNFPLLDEKTRGHAEDTTEQLDLNEAVVLLDPCMLEDVDLLTFELIDGKPWPAFAKDADPDKHFRASRSIELYHLHEETLRVTRRDKMLKVQRLVNRADTTKDRQVKKETLRELARELKSGQEHVWAAWVVLHSLRAQSGTADSLIKKAGRF